MELITKLIILATAILGLYKAATFDRSKFTGASNYGHFAPFLQLAGMLLFMLAIPAFVWAFMSLTKSMVTPSEAPHEILPISPSIPVYASVDDILLTAAAGLPNFYSKSDTLTSIVSYALSKGDFRTATSAALLLGSSSDRDRELLRSIAAMTDTPSAPLPEKTADSVQPPPISTPK